MPNRPTLKTIAQMAGLSHVAVSKALRDAPDISSATKERVKKIADDLGYTPNVAARNLYLQRTSTIGMIVPAMGVNTTYDLIFNEISAAAAALDYCVMLGSSHRSRQLEVRHCRMMVGNQVGALIVAPTSSDVSHIKAVCTAVPIIFIGGKIDPAEPCALLCDYRHSGMLAVEHLTSLGHRDIAFLAYGPENRTILQKTEGYTQAMVQRGLSPRVLRLGDASNAMGAGMEAVERLLEQESLPTAVWCASDYMALGVISALRTHGFSIPGDISIMGHDDLYFSTFPSVRLTTFHTPIAEISRAAVDLAVHLMEDRPSPVPLQQTFHPFLVVRNSTGAPRC